MLGPAYDEDEEKPLNQYLPSAVAEERASEIEYQENNTDSYNSDSEDSEYNNTVGTQLMNNESIGPSQENTYEHPDYQPDMSASDLALYVSSSVEKQQALDMGRITIAHLREESEDDN